MCLCVPHIKILEHPLLQTGIYHFCTDIISQKKRKEKKEEKKDQATSPRSGSFEVRAPEPRELFNLILSNLSGSPFRFLTFSPLFTLLQNYITPVPEGYAIAICNLHSSPKGAMS